MAGSVKLGASGFAEYAAAAPSARTLNKLRPFKFPNKGEGAGRSRYYKLALNAIRKYHANNNDRGVFRAAEQEIVAAYDIAVDKHAKTKLARNLAALQAYESVYGERRFAVRRNHRLACRIDSVTVTAQPDLWAEEDGQEVILKIGVAKKRVQQIELLLALLRRASIESGYKVRSRNVLYLDVTNGKEISFGTPLKRYAKFLRSVAREIADAWDRITESAIP